MNLPPLEFSSRDREFKHYGRDLRESIVIKYLFEGLSSRSLDENVLGLDKNKSKGYQSWAILKYYGLSKEYKGIFKDMSPSEVLEIIPNEPQFNTLYDIISGSSEEIDLEFSDSIKGMDKICLVKTRVHQDIFRKKILNAYCNTCCITGINDPCLLRASHIKPWRDSNEDEKTDVHNGLCLNALHDAAFDVGLITVSSSDFTIRLSSRIEEYMDECTYNDYFRRYEGTQINLPTEDDIPKAEYLNYHKHNIFDRIPVKLKTILQYESI